MPFSKDKTHKFVLEDAMKDNFSRRDAIGLGLSAAALATAGTPARAAVKAADVASPNFKIESGASLKMLRPVRFVKPDEDLFRTNAQRFADKTGVPVQVDFVGWDDINQQTAVTANTGAGPDIIIGFQDAPHIYSDKLIELTEVADYLDKRYGGWLFLAKKYGMRHGTNAWIGLPFGASAGPVVYRKSMIEAAGYSKIPDAHDKFLDLCMKLHKMGKPSGFALGNAVGDGNTFANWLLWSHNAALTDKDGNLTINSKETIAACNYVKQLYPYMIPGTISWNDVSNNRAYAAGEISLTTNGVSLYFSLKNDPATAAIAADTEHTNVPLGLSQYPATAGLTMNAMAFKHSKYPNAAKAFLQFMLEHEQYEPWMNANNGYWSNPLAAYADCDVWTSDPKVAFFKNSMSNHYWPGYAGPISAATGSISADFVTVQMFASVATGSATPAEAAAEAERRAQRYFRR
jgi:multiple sugar transport system substrate-binding protein